MNRQALLAALDWQYAMGAEDALGSSPTDWGAFAAPQWWREARVGNVNGKLASPAEAKADAIASALPRTLYQSAAPATNLATNLNDNAAPALFPESVTPRLTTPVAVNVVARTLEALAAEWKASDYCGLKKTALNFVFGEGDPARRIMLIGEGPGADEDKQGRPFVGRSGQLLDKMLAAIGLMSRADYYITNVTPWRPPGNREPTAAEIAVLRPYLVRHIELANPQVIVTLGGLATKALLARPEGITRLRGKFLDFAPAEGMQPIKLLPMFHPSALLRNPANKKQSWQDLLTLKEFLKVNNLLLPAL